MDNDERRRVKDLLREKEKGDEPLQWMYKASKPEEEDFLLGRRIDKIGEDEDKKDDQFQAMFGERIQHNIEMDSKAKMREDPLFAIRKKEEDAKRRLLENPVKMKRLQKSLEKQKAAQEKKAKKKKKKHKGNNSHDSDEDLMSAYLNILTAKHKGGTGGGKTGEGMKEERDSRQAKHDKNQTHGEDRQQRSNERLETRGDDRGRGDRSRHDDNQTRGFGRDNRESARYERGDRGQGSSRGDNKGADRYDREDRHKGNVDRTPEHRRYREDLRERNMDRYDRNYKSQRERSHDQRQRNVDRSRDRTHNNDRHRNSEWGYGREKAVKASRQASSDAFSSDSDEERKHKNSKTRDKYSSDKGSKSRVEPSRESHSKNRARERSLDRYDRNSSRNTDRYMDRSRQHDTDRGRNKTQNDSDSDNDYRKRSKDQARHRYDSDSSVSDGAPSKRSERSRQCSKNANGNRQKHDNTSSSSDLSSSDNENTSFRKSYQKEQQSIRDLEQRSNELKQRQKIAPSSSDSESNASDSVDERRSVQTSSRGCASQRKAASRGRCESSSDYSDSSGPSSPARRGRHTGSKPHRTASTDSDSEQEKPKPRKNYGLVILNEDNEVMKQRSKVKPSHKYRSPSTSPERSRVKRKRSRSRTPPKQQLPKRKLTAEEKAARLAEMQENARWREDQRKTNVTRYADEERREQDSQKHNYNITGSSEFVNPLMSLHASSSSVEDRIKRNKHNILRTNADMDRGFSKR